MSYRIKLDRLVAGNQEVFPGQTQEIKTMTYTAGCDIAEHVPTLIEYGRKCSVITEMGVRFGWSTRSFLYARPKKLLSIDKFQWNSVHPSGAVQGCGNCEYLKYSTLYAGLVDFQYQIGDTTKIPSIEPTELLFIDTFHHRDCLAIELNKHGNQATKYIILHDTETFGRRGQADSSLLFFDQVTTNDDGTGLWYAINPWLTQNRHWVLKEHHPNNNGLTILERKQ